MSYMKRLYESSVLERLYESSVLATVPSSSGNKTYDIILGGDGVTYCTCVAWKMHKTCKHLTAYLNNQSINVKPAKTAKATVQNSSIDELIAREVAFLKNCR